MAIETTAAIAAIMEIERMFYFLVIGGQRGLGIAGASIFDARTVFVISMLLRMPQYAKAMEAGQ